jgi:ribonuclease HI
MMGKHRSRRRNKRTKCLYATHNVRTIADLLKTKRRIDQKEGEQKHRRDVRYKCSDCKLDKERGCASPWRCAEEAKEMLLDIRPKWNAQETRYEDGLSLRSPEKEHNKENTQERGLVTFDPLVTVKTNVNGCIQIFVDPFRSADTPAVREQPPARGRTSHDSKIVVYTDGSSLNNRSAIATCGSGVWFGENDERNIATRPPTEDQSNQVGEIAAVILAARAVPDFVELEIRSDSLTTIEGLTQHLETWENRGWIGVKNSEILRVAAYQLRKRSAPTRFQWVKGHSGDTGNEEADKLAGEAAKRPEKDNMNLEIPLEFRITGARLDSMTQALAYRAIKARKHAPKPRGRTASNVTETQDALAGYAGTPPTTQRIWRSIRHKDFRLPVKHFLYKTIHAIHKIGKYWTVIPGYEERGTCRVCGEIETMRHILVECNIGRRKILWDLAEATWGQDEFKWPDIGMGIIMGCGLLQPPAREEVDKNDEGEYARRAPAGRSRLMRILISETAFLIWKLRNGSTIEGIEIPTRVAISRWNRAIGDRLRTDRMMAAHKKENDEFRHRVDATWCMSIDENGNEPAEDWNWNMNRDVKLTVASDMMKRFFSGSSPTLPDPP